MNELQVLPVVHEEDIPAWFCTEVAKVTGLDPANITPQSIREALLRLESGMKVACEGGKFLNTLEQYPIEHRFAPGVYCRELTIPAGHIVIGKLHKHSHLNFISKGKVTVLTESGGFETLVAPCTMISPAGTKRFLITHEDTVWSTVHPTQSTNLDEIEAETIARDYEEYDTLTNRTVSAGGVI